jgi:hypothetical protein
MSNTPLKDTLGIEAVWAALFELASLGDWARNGCGEAASRTLIMA